MDCRTAQDRLRWLPPEGVGAVRTEDDLATHLLECGLCRVVHESRKFSEHQIAAQIRDVPIPAGAQDRLQTLLAQAQTVAAQPAPAVPVHYPRRAWLVSAAATVLLTVAVGWGWWLRQAPLLSMAAVQQSVFQQIDATGPVEWAAYEGEPVAISDPGWRRIGSQAPRGLNLDHHPGHDAAAFMFSHGSVRGVLVVVPAARLQDAPQDGVPGVPAYAPRSWAAWRTGDQVYLCVAINGDLRDILQAGPAA